METDWTGLPALGMISSTSALLLFFFAKMTLRWFF